MALGDVLAEAFVSIKPEFNAAEFRAAVTAAMGGATGADPARSLSQGFTAAGAAMTAVGSTLTRGVTLPLVGVAAAAVKTGIDYQQSMNVLQAASQATGGQMDQLRSTAMALGADMTLPGTSAADAGEAMLELSRAGLSVNDVLGASRGVLELSAAGQLGNAEAAMITASALNSFGLEGTRAADVANMLANGANASQADVSQMGAAMSQAAAVFNTAGFTVEDLTTGIALMAKQGIIGSDAGTSLKTMAMRLIAPTEQAAGTMRELGVNVYDAAGNVKPFRDIVGELSPALAGLSEEQRNAALQTIFGADAIRAASILTQGGTAAFDEMAAAVTAAGGAQAMAEAQTKGLGGAFGGLVSTLETAAIQLTGPIMGGLETIVRGLASFIEMLMGAPGPVMAFVGAFLAVVAAAGPVLMILGAIATAIGFLLSPIGLVVLGLALLAGAFASNLFGIRDLIMGTVVPAIVTGFGMAVDFITGTVVPALQNIWTAIEPALSALGEFITGTVLPALGSLASFIADNIVPILAGLAAVIGGVLLVGFALWAKAAVALGLGMTALATPVLGIIAAIALLAAGAVYAYQNFEWFRAAVDAVVAFITGTAIPAIAQFASFLMTQLGAAISWITAQWPLFLAAAQNVWAVLGPIIQAALTVIVTAITTAFTVIQTIVATAVTIILTLWRAFGDELIALVQIAWTQLGGIISAALTIVRGIITAILGLISGDWGAFWSGLGTIFQGLWSLLVTMIQAAVATLAVLFSVALSAIGAAWSIFWTTLGAVVQVAWALITGLVQAGWAMLQAAFQVGTTLLNALWTTFWSALSTAASAAWALIQTIIAAGWAVIQAVFAAAVAYLVNEWQVFWTSLQTIATTVWSAIQAFLAAGLAALQALWTAVWAAIQAVTEAVWAAILAIISAAMAAVQALISAAMAAIQALWSAAWAAMQAVAAAAWAVIQSLISAAMSAIQSLISAALSTIQGLWSSAWSAIQSLVSSAMSTMQSTISSGISAIIGFFRAMPGQILGALGNLGGLLTGAGRSLIEGFLGGIRSAWNAGKGFLGGIAGEAAKLKGPLPYDKVVLEPNGRALITGLMEGVKAELPGFYGQMASIAPTLRRRIGSDLGPLGLANGSRFTSVPFPTGGPALTSQLGGGGVTVTIRQLTVTLDRSTDVSNPEAIGAGIGEGLTRELERRRLVSAVRKAGSSVR